MAKQVVSVFIDDLSGEELQPDNHRQIRCSLDGDEYVIDLDLAHAEEFLALFRRYTQAAAPVRKAPNQQRQNRSAKLQKVREWARSQGIVVANRGRISAEVLAAYEQALH
jgi:hypothetical protein